MSIFPSSHILDVSVNTSFTMPIDSSLLSIARLPTDPIYYADIDYTNFQAGSSYKTSYNDTNAVISSGVIAGDFTVSNVSANDAIEIIVTKARKYGYKEYNSTIAHSRAGAVIYGAQIVDNNITELNETTVAGYVGYAYDGVAKTLTVPNNATINNAYDFGSYSAALLSNIDYEYPLSTAIGVNYVMPSGWLLITGNGINNVNLTGDIRIDSVNDLTGLNLNGSLTFTVAGTYTLTDCTINSVANTSGGNVIINSAGSTAIANNLNPGTITIQSTASINVTNLVAGSRVKITRDDTGEVLLNSIESGGAVSLATTYIGAFTVVARKASTAPYYKQWTSGGVTTNGSTSSIKALQELD